MLEKIHTSGLMFISLLLVSPLSLKENEEKMLPEIRGSFAPFNSHNESFFLLECLKIDSNESQLLSIVRDILIFNCSTKTRYYVGLTEGNISENTGLG